ncbi:kinesin-like protein KIF23 [Anthonomus grandis grandis]|uniref:kinesin-like protein KIF23 n=1 Tax=Anthonomus grandis grandis TaxID=2921223 RepID=UPI002165EF1E|nr:kinesin-like protein KIF23 [Anthonomus grandis grandis]
MNSANRYNTPSAKRLKREKTTVSNNSNSDKDPVHVYCRLRPLEEGSEPSSCIKILSANTLGLYTPESKSVTKEVHYKFKHIFTGFSTQSEIFNHVAYPLLEDVLNGKNGLLFTYGVTGSGKTYTLTGNENDPGILPRTIDTLFNSIEGYQAPKCVIKSDKMNGFEIQAEDDALQDRLQACRNYGKTPKANRKGSGEKLHYVNAGTRIQNINEMNLYSVFVSYVEIYNNSVFDLLDDSSGKTLQNKILREDRYKNMYVNGVVEVEVKSAQEAFDAFNAGQFRKKVAATALNSGSSRSHSIFNIRVVQLEQSTINSEGQPAVPSENYIKVGQLSLVDLAGSERTNRTNNIGMRLKEASSINNSLMSLRTCLEILRDNQINKNNRLVPYRDSRLTFLFKHYFEGDGTVKMIVCINPTVDDFEENVQVLKFAEMTQDVKISKPEVRYNTIKKTIARNKENQNPIKTKISSSFTLLPEVPMVKFNVENWKECQSAIDKVLNILKLRSNKKLQISKEMTERQQDLRKKLVHLNQQCVLTSAEIKSLKTVIHKEKAKSKNELIKMRDLEAVNQELEAKNEELLSVVRCLKQTINEKDLKINQHLFEKERTKQRLDLAQEKMSQELDAKLRRQRDHLNSVMKAKDEKLRMVKGILESELPPIEMNMIDIDNTIADLTAQNTVKSVGSQLTQTSKTHTPTTSQVHRRNITGTPAPRSRRSRSAGEVWLEHNVIKPCPLGTVMQPTMKKRKSVSKLDKASDITNPKQSKYCLVAQEPDTEGELETKLYKADIVPTCGGGAQVIFNDVERLKQESPTKSS